MNLTATASSIAASGGIRPDSHITARPVTARKAGPVALNLARVIEGQRSFLFRCSDLSPSSTLSGGVEADLNARNCIENASNPLVVSGHAQRMTNTSLKTAINIAGVAPRPLNFPRGPLEACTLHDQKRLVSPARRCGNADLTLTGQRRYTAGAAFLAFLGNRRPARSGGGYGLWPATALCKTSPHYRRHLGNPCVEKAGACRSRSIFSP